MVAMIAAGNDLSTGLVGWLTEHIPIKLIHSPLVIAGLTPAISMQMASVCPKEAGWPDEPWTSLAMTN
jgi:hypothetical protein